jgi:hypothetical protein
MEHCVLVDGHTREHRRAIQLIIFVKLGVAALSLVAHQCGLAIGGWKGDWKAHKECFFFMWALLASLKVAS